MREPPINEIVEKIVAAFHPRRIVLFGSRARVKVPLVPGTPFR